MSLHRSRPSPFSSFLRHLHHMPSPPSCLQQLSSFDHALALALHSLIPPAHQRILCLPWLGRALDLALDKYKEAVQLIPPLEFPFTARDEKWMNEFMDQTARILDVCNALLAGVSDIEQGHLLIRHAVHTLGDPITGLKEDKLRRAQKSLREWIDTAESRKEECPCEEDLSGNLKTKKCSVILQDMFKSLVPPRERAISKGKSFVFALYGANVTAVFIFHALALALLRDDDLMSVSLLPPNQTLWWPSISHLSQLVRQEASQTVSAGSTICLADLHVLKNSVIDLLNKLEPFGGEEKVPFTKEQAEKLAVSIQSLNQNLDFLSEGLDFVGRRLNEISHAVVASRSALLDQLGNFGTGDDV